jgi:hypothetical protein
MVRIDAEAVPSGLFLPLEPEVGTEGEAAGRFGPRAQRGRRCEFFIFKY